MKPKVRKVCRIACAVFSAPFMLLGVFTTTVAALIIAGYATGGRWAASVIRDL